MASSGIPQDRAIKINKIQLRDLIRQEGWNKQLTYDYDRKRALFNGADVDFGWFEGELQDRYSVDFCFTWLRNTLTEFAKRNSPKPQTDEDALLELLSEYLIDKKETTVKQLIDAHKEIPGFLVHNRALEMQIAKCLKQIGYKTVRRKANGVDYRIWVKSSTPSSGVIGAVNQDDAAETLTVTEFETTGVNLSMETKIELDGLLADLRNLT